MFRRWILAPLILAGMLSLVAAVWAGLVRMGWRWPLAVESWPAVHGALMVSGFLGTVIALERAVGLGRRWALAAPALTALGALALLAGKTAVAPLLFLAGSTTLAVVYGAIARRHFSPASAMILSGILCWVAGNVLWAAGLPIGRVAPWWLGFLTLTIAGERLELSRVLAPPPSAVRLLAAAAGFLFAAMVLSLFDLVAGERAFGLGLIVVALWLYRYDIAWRSARGYGQMRYTALCLLSGYFWLAIGGGVFLLGGAGAVGGPYYDAALHAILLGFVFAMIFGHALIIFPALLQLRLPYRPVFYLPLALLHLSLAVRLIGDLSPEADAVRRLGGLLNAAAIALFLALLGFSALRGRRAPEASG